MNPWNGGRGPTAAKSTLGGCPVRRALVSIRERESATTLSIPHMWRMVELGELGNVVEVTSLSGRVLIGSIVQSIGERLVIGQHVEWSGFEEMSEMFDG